MTPLGGLAMAMARRRPWPTFATVAGGPLVNVLICLVCTAGLYHTYGFFPLGPWQFGTVYLKNPGWFQAGHYFFWFYAISYALLLFNLLPVFPLDGGQLLQAILWKPLGYYRSMIATLTVGLVGSALMIAVGVSTFGTIGGGLLLVLIGVSCLLTCYRTRMVMKAEGPGRSATRTRRTTAPTPPPPTATTGRRRNRAGVRAARRAEREAQAEVAEQERIDRILAKVSAQGMHSLTWREKRALHKATENQRKRDLALQQRARR